MKRIILIAGLLFVSIPIHVDANENRIAELESQVEELEYAVEAITEYNAKLFQAYSELLFEKYTVFDVKHEELYDLNNYALNTQNVNLFHLNDEVFMFDELVRILLGEEGYESEYYIYTIDYRMIIDTSDHFELQNSVLLVNGQEANTIIASETSEEGLNMVESYNMYVLPVHPNEVEEVVWLVEDLEIELPFEYED